jgi:hypothetical protein
MDIWSGNRPGRATARERKCPLNWIFIAFFAIPTQLHPAQLGIARSLEGVQRSKTHGG